MSNDTPLDRFRTALTGAARAIAHDAEVDVAWTTDQPAPGEGWWLPARLGGSAPDHDEVVAAHQARFEAQRDDEAAS